MKHRGPDSTGYAVYGPVDDLIVVRFVLAEPLKSTGFGMEERLERNRAEVEGRLAKIGAEVATVTSDTGYAFRATIRYSGDLKSLADYLEDVPGCEVLSLGSSLEIIKDLGDAATVSDQYGLGLVPGHARHRPRAHGHRVRGRPGQRPPLLGLPVRRRGRGPQRPAHQLPPVAPSSWSSTATASRASATPRSSPCTSPSTWPRGLSLETAMKHSLDDLDGVFTYVCVTGNELGIAKDEMAAKPLVLFESDPLVVVATEEVAIRALVKREVETRDPYERRGAGMAGVGSRSGVSYDARGLVEPPCRDA